jgi:beta-glucanase (GH16 family)
VRISGGSLNLVAEQRNTSTTWGQAMAYASGAIHTHGKFAFTYGVVEARVQIASGRGIYPVLALLPLNKRSPPEINLLMALGQDPFTVNQNFKFFDFDGNGRMLSATMSGSDFSAEFHTYTLYWTDRQITFYLDGVPRASYNGNSVLKDDAFLMFSQAIGGTVPGSPDASTVFPAATKIDYIRVWQ